MQSGALPAENQAEYYPLQFFVHFLSRLKTARLTDERCKIMNEIISGMRVVKISTWELSFRKLINKVRR